MVDTGNSYLGSPEDYFSKSAETIRQKFPKYAHKSLPNLIFEIEGDEYPLEPNYYLATQEKQETADELLQNSWFVSMSVTISESSKPLYILGQSFLSKYYNIYNFEKGQVGFAQAKHS